MMTALIFLTTLSMALVGYIIGWCAKDRKLQHVAQDPEDRR